MFFLKGAYEYTRISIKISAIVIVSFVIYDYLTPKTVIH